MHCSLQAFIRAVTKQASHLEGQSAFCVATECLILKKRGMKAIK
jgi:hypothetical protein